MYVRTECVESEMLEDIPFPGADLMSTRNSGNDRNINERSVAIGRFSDDCNSFVSAEEGVSVFDKQVEMLLSHLD